MLWYEFYLYHHEHLPHGGIDVIIFHGNATQMNGSIYMSSSIANQHLKMLGTILCNNHENVSNGAEHFV